MPVRTIKRVEMGSGVGTKNVDKNKLVLRVPEAIVQGIHLRKGDILVCEFKNHYNNEQELITEINESGEVHCRHKAFGESWYESYYLDAPHYIILTDLKLMQKYGFLANEYLEIIFKEIKREKELISIFSGRMIEDLDFTPK